MGIPYSREINAAFDQVTPLVAAAYEVLQTTKNIAILLAFIQIGTVVLLSFILFALLGLLITLNPDLEKERKDFVTPVMVWLAGWVYTYGRLANWMLRVSLVVSTACLGLFLWQGSLSGKDVPDKAKDEEGEEDSDEKKSGESKE